MAEPSSFIKLDRSILNWRWYTNGNTFRLFTHLLLKANYVEKDWNEVTIKRGELVTSVSHLSEETGLTVKEVRVALGHLKRTSEVAIRATSQYTVITILNYDKYQGGANQTTNEGQTEDKQEAIKGQQLKNIKNIRNKENKEVYTCSNGFDDFWKVYPRKVAKTNAKKVWDELKPDTGLQETIIKAVERQKQSQSWLKDNGQFITYPATWLSGKRWEDEIGTDKALERQQKPKKQRRIEFVEIDGEPVARVYDD